MCAFSGGAGAGPDLSVPGAERCFDGRVGKDESCIRPTRVPRSPSVVVVVVVSVVGVAKAMFAAGLELILLSPIPCRRSKTTTGKPYTK